jgi:sterol desaturase/sphingolipid hydroxylase (fatty acid hydroxylase superfamily)
VVIATAFVTGCLSMLLRRRKVLGLTGAALALLAALLFVPLERFFPRLPEQGTFRLGWTTDTLHFFIFMSHLLVQVLSFLILLPGVTVSRFWMPTGLAAVVRGLSLWVQFLAAVLVADVAQYAVHRAFHQVPMLWRFHAVHHSSRDLDWLAGSRLHVVDAVTTRALVLVPLQLLGFAESALYAYLVFVSFHAVFIHANVRFSFGDRGQRVRSTTE